MQINPARRNCQEHDQGSGHGGLPTKREAKSQSEPAPASGVALFGGGCFGQRRLDAQPERRRVGVVAQFFRRNAERLPGAEFFGTLEAVGAVRFESRPFGGRAILKNSVAIFTFKVHRRSPCSRSAVAARRLKHLAKISLRLKKCVL